MGPLTEEVARPKFSSAVVDAVEKHAKAVDPGGRYAECGSYRQRHHLRIDGADGRFDGWLTTIFMSPNKLRTDIDFGGGLKNSSIFNGIEGWRVTAGGGLVRMSAAELAVQSLRAKMANPKLRATDIFPAISLDRDSDAIRLICDSGIAALSSVIIVLDPESFLTREMWFNSSDEMAVDSYRISLSDYSMRAGIMVPGKVVIISPLGRQTMILDGIELDAELGDADFKPGAGG